MLDTRDRGQCYNQLQGISHPACQCWTQETEGSVTISRRASAIQPVSAGHKRQRAVLQSVAGHQPPSLSVLDTRDRGQCYNQLQGISHPACQCWTQETEGSVTISRRASATQPVSAGHKRQRAVLQSVAGRQPPSLSVLDTRDRGQCYNQSQGVSHPACQCWTQETEGSVTISRRASATQPVSAGHKRQRAVLQSVAGHQPPSLSVLDTRDRGQCYNQSQGISHPACQCWTQETEESVTISRRASATQPVSAGHKRQRTVLQSVAGHQPPSLTVLDTRDRGQCYNQSQGVSHPACQCWTQETDGSRTISRRASATQPVSAGHKRQRAVLQSVAGRQPPSLSVLGTRDRGQSYNQSQGISHPACQCWTQGTEDIVTISRRASATQPVSAGHKRQRAVLQSVAGHQPPSLSVLDTRDRGQCYNQSQGVSHPACQCWTQETEDSVTISRRASATQPDSARHKRQRAVLQSVAGRQPPSLSVLDTRDRGQSYNQSQGISHPACQCWTQETEGSVTISRRASATQPVSAGHKRQRTVLQSVTGHQPPSLSVLDTRDRGAVLQSVTGHQPPSLSVLDTRDRGQCYNQSQGVSHPACQCWTQETEDSVTISRRASATQPVRSGHKRQRTVLQSVAGHQPPSLSVLDTRDRGECYNQSQGISHPACQCWTQETEDSVTISHRASATQPVSAGHKRQRTVLQSVAGRQPPSLSVLDTRDRGQCYNQSQGISHPACQIWTQETEDSVTISRRASATQPVSAGHKRQRRVLQSVAGHQPPSLSVLDTRDRGQCYNQSQGISHPACQCWTQETEEERPYSTIYEHLAMTCTIRVFRTQQIM